MIEMDNKNFVSAQEPEEEAHGSTLDFLKICAGAGAIWLRRLYFCEIVNNYAEL